MRWPLSEISLYLHGFTVDLSTAEANYYAYIIKSTSFISSQESADIYSHYAKM